MNYSTAILLANPALGVITASYEQDENGKAMVGTVLPYKVPPGLTLNVGDYVVVPTNTRHKMTVCRVEEIDHELDVDYPKELAWVVDKVEQGRYLSIKAAEESAIQAVKSAEKRARREEMAEKLKKDNPAFANLGQVGAPALAAPAAPVHADPGDDVIDPDPLDEPF